MDYFDTVSMVDVVRILGCVKTTTCTGSLSIVAAKIMQKPQTKKALKVSNKVVTNSF